MATAIREVPRPPLQPGDGRVGRPEDKAEVLRRAREAVDAVLSDEGWIDSRDRCETAFAFYDGDQWPDDIKEVREADGRPCLVINKTRKFVQSVVGEYRQNKTSIKVRPVDDQSDPEVARIREGLIRTIESDSKATDVIYPKALEHAVIGGWGVWRVAIEWPDDEVYEAIIRLRLIHNPLSFYIDPASREYDLTDARFVLITEWFDRSRFKETFPDAALSDFDGSLSDRAYQWYDDSNDQIRVAEFWWQESYTREIALVVDDRGQQTTIDLSSETDQEWVKWLKEKGYILRSRKAKGTRIRYALVSGSEVLWGPKTWPGKYFPFAVSFGADSVVDGVRKLQGLVYSMIDPQRMYNLWRSYTAEILALQPKVPWVGPKGFAGTGQQKRNWEQSHRASIPYLEYDGDRPPSRPAPPAYPQGLDKEAANCTQDLKETSGIFDASLGAKSNETSGRAILARQQQAQSALAIYLDNHRFAITHTGRIINDLLQYVYDTPRVMRILGEDKEEPEMVGINGAVMYDDQGQAKPTVDLSVGRYDIVSTVGPSYATARLEAFDAMKEIGKILGPDLFMTFADKWVEYGGFPGGDEIAEKIREMRMTGGQISPEIQQQIMQLVMQAVPSPQALEQMVQAAIAKAMGGGGPPPEPPQGPPMPPQGPPMGPQMPPPDVPA